MCLSTVYQIVDGEPQEVAKLVSGAVVGDGTVTFTDLMGVETVLEGRIASVDLMDNKIVVEPLAVAS